MSEGWPPKPKLGMNGAGWPTLFLDWICINEVAPPSVGFKGWELRVQPTGFISGDVGRRNSLELQRCFRYSSRKLQLAHKG
jgi:hypothetical protein